jgi:hypothetical protein
MPSPGLFDAEDSVDEEDHWMLRQLADKTGGKITEAVVDPTKVREGEGEGVDGRA